MPNPEIPLTNRVGCPHCPISPIFIKGDIVVCNLQFELRLKWPMPQNGAWFYYSDGSIYLLENCKSIISALRKHEQIFCGKNEI